MRQKDDPTGGKLLSASIDQMARGIDLPNFCHWFADHYSVMFAPGAAGRTSTAEAAKAEAEARRAATALARQLWRLTPDPAHGWRQRTVAQPGRNDLCYCGSGRKFKQCCQSLAATAPQLEFESSGLAGMLFAAGPASWRTPAALRAMPPDTLAAAAHAWGESKGALALVQLLEPLFQTPEGLGDKHDLAFDLVVDAMQAQGLDARRTRLAEAVAQSATSRTLRCTAHCRLATMAADQGDNARSWSEFRLAQRIDPEAMELLHLELALLLAEDRRDEARARAPLLAARARKFGNPELADVLIRMAEDGLSSLFDAGGADPALDDEEQAWVALLREPLQHLDAASFGCRHDIRCVGEGELGQLELVPGRVLQRDLKNWVKRYSPVAPTLTGLYGEAEALLDEPVGAREWLAQRPDCAGAVTVLDDLLLAAREMTDASDAPGLLRAACELAFASAEMIVAALAPWEQAQLQWVVPGNRPALRVVAQAIDLALQTHDDARAMVWMRWMLARNPNDNHGWRGTLRLRLLRSGAAEDALALLDAYPHDGPPSGHDRALALFQLGRAQEAEATLRQVHAAHPAFVAALGPAALDRPAADRTGYLAVGGAQHAWEWRAGARDAWSRAGALDWLRGLQLPDKPPAARRRARVARSNGVAPPSAGANPTAAPRKGGPRRNAAVADLEVLRSHFGTHLPWLLGRTAAVAWAPALVMPSEWLIGALEHAANAQDGAEVQRLVESLMDLYNALNQDRLDARADAPVALPAAIAADDDEGWTRFAAGFVQASEKLVAAVWRKAGVPVGVRGSSLFAPLYQLAARAPVSPDGWRAAGDSGQPVLALADEAAPPVRELLERALQPLWQRTLSARNN